MESTYPHCATVYEKKLHGKLVLLLQKDESRWGLNFYFIGRIARTLIKLLRIS